LVHNDLTGSANAACNIKISQQWKLKYMPVWCFHLESVAGVPLSDDRQMMDALKKYNPNNRFMIYPGSYHGSDHDARTEAYNRDSPYTWLLTQTKFAFHEIEISPSQLQKFAGVYVTSDNPADSDVIMVQGESSGRPPRMYFSSARTGWRPSSFPRIEPERLPD